MYTLIYYKNILVGTEIYARIDSFCPSRENGTPVSTEFTTLYYTTQYFTFLCRILTRGKTINYLYLQQQQYQISFVLSCSKQHYLDLVLLTCSPFTCSSIFIHSNNKYSSVKSTLISCATPPTPPHPIQSNSIDLSCLFFFYSADGQTLDLISRLILSWKCQIQGGFFKVQGMDDSPPLWKSFNFPLISHAVNVIIDVLPTPIHTNRQIVPSINAWFKFHLFHLRN